MGLSDSDDYCRRGAHNLLQACVGLQIRLRSSHSPFTHLVQILHIKLHALAKPDHEHRQIGHCMDGDRLPKAPAVQELVTLSQVLWKWRKRRDKCLPDWRLLSWFMAMNCLSGMM